MNVYMLTEVGAQPGDVNEYTLQWSWCSRQASCNNLCV